jgi:hypothetical protein
MLEELEALYRERLHEYTRLATALAGDEESGRDAVQDAFAKAVRNRRRSDPLMDAYLERGWSYVGGQAYGRACNDRASLGFEGCCRAGCVRRLLARRRVR